MAKDKKTDELKPEINISGDLITVTIKIKNDKDRKSTLLNTSHSKQSRITAFMR